MEAEKQRLDKWLWAARFFKTRALAAEAVSGGKVHLHGDRIKPGRTVKVGDQLSITKGLFEYVIIICSLNRHRRPASEAQLMYQESDESIQARTKQAETAKAMNSHIQYSDKRPSKKQRRQIVRFKRVQNP
ncbi:MAG: S4 domain-containing protein [Gammaproteobacteria bacterium]|nr:S4 domain-containing protein [Gammaproteobacteria bacterium]